MSTVMKNSPAPAVLKTVISTAIFFSIALSFSFFTPLYVAQAVQSLMDRQWPISWRAPAITCSKSRSPSTMNVLLHKYLGGGSELGTLLEEPRNPISRFLHPMF